MFDVMHSNNFKILSPELMKYLKLFTAKNNRVNFLAKISAKIKNCLSKIT